MKKIIVFGFLLVSFLIASQAQAAVVTLFEDDFSGGFDSAKWSKVETNTATATVTGGELDCYLPNMASSAGLLSVPINLPSCEILNVTVSGKFMSPYLPTAGITMTMSNAANSTKYVHTEHGYWIDGYSSGFDISLVDSGVSGSYTVLPAVFPEDYTDFSFYFTEDTWEYWEDGSLVKAFSSTTLQSSADAFTLQFGVYDGSLNYQHAYFDDIKMVAEVRDTVVPEPVTMSLMGLGLLGFGVTKRKRRNS